LYGDFYSLKLENGEKNWSYLAENQFSGAPNYWRGNGKTYILIGSYDYYLHCIDANTGKNVWKYESNNYINGAVSINNNKAIFGGCDGLLHIVAINTGKADDMIEVATYVAGSPGISDNVAFIGDYDGGFTAIDLISKKEKWKWVNETSHLPFIASPSVYKEKVIVGNQNKFIYCFNKNDGTLFWKYNSGNKVDASCVVSPKAVLGGNTRGDLFLISLSDGKPIWNYELGSAIFSNPVLVNNKIIVGAGDGNIYCLGKK
jgi:outer membrane protein assembly factor BamB